MKKSIITLSVAAAMGGFAGSASAQAVDHLIFNPTGVGHILLVPYFSTQSANVTAINIVNTDTVRGKVVKVRFRGASNSDDVYDFQVFLSPGDVWAAGISRGADGRSELLTTDKSCTLPANVNGSFIIGRTATQAPDRNAETREGYIEFLNMGDIVQGATGSSKRALYNATKHVNGVAPCTSSVMTALTHENAADYMEKPTTGLMSNWGIINVERWLVYSGAAAAIEAQNIATGDPIAGNLVYWDQRATLLTPGEITANTADPLLVKGHVLAARYDLPDLSTPYLGSCCTPAAQALELSDSIAARTIAGEFNNQSSLGASTDWVVSFPTRRYHAAVRYTGSGAPAAVFGADNPYFNSLNTDLKGYQLCSALGMKALTFYNREETPVDIDDIVISPGTPSSFSVCGEVAVVGINSGIAPGQIANSATFGALTRTNVDNGFVEGWGYFTTPSAYGLPMLARQFSRYENTQTRVFYGTSYPARTLEKGMMAP